MAARALWVRGQQNGRTLVAACGASRGISWRSAGSPSSVTRLGGEDASGLQWTPSAPGGRAVDPRSMRGGGGRGITSYGENGETRTRKEGFTLTDTLHALADLRGPQTWFPAARRMRRKWIVHMGPTNSGKTYHALKRLAESNSGAYCGPLRLLAWEVHDKLCEGAIDGKKVECNLITGQERVEFAGSKHRSSTIEMVDLYTRMEVGVVDEMQMVANNDRGWAWSRAILGLPVEELHLCGEARTINLLKQLCDMCGDDMEIKEYQRLSPLKVASRSLGGSLDNVQSGDCIVAFGRHKIYDIKKEIEKSTSHKCCVVYGSLPPETRKEQAKLFNGRHNNSGFDVMVASDAVGMGLNLEVKRIVFSAMEKFDGTETRPLTDSEVLQIAGRAGRYGTESSHGIVTTLHVSDMSSLARSMKAKMPQLKKACLRPELHMLEEFARGLTERWRRNKFRTSLNEPPAVREPGLHIILSAFSEVHQSDGCFFLTDAMDDLKAIAEALQDIKMPLKDRFMFCMAPVDVENSATRGALLDLAKMFSEDRIVRAPHYMRSMHEREVPTTVLQLQELEQAHTILELYLWLANHFREEFVDAAFVREAVAVSNDLMQKGLSSLTRSDRAPGRSSRSPEKTRADRRANKLKLREISAGERDFMRYL